MKKELFEKLKPLEKIDYNIHYYGIETLITHGALGSIIILLLVGIFILIKVKEIWVIIYGAFAFVSLILGFCNYKYAFYKLDNKYTKIAIRNMEDKK